MDPSGKVGVNCFRTHNEFTMGLLGKLPLAPSVSWDGSCPPRVAGFSNYFLPVFQTSDGLLNLHRVLVTIDKTFPSLTGTFLSWAGRPGASCNSLGFPGTTGPGSGPSPGAEGTVWVDIEGSGTVELGSCCTSWSFLCFGGTTQVGMGCSLSSPGRGHWQVLSL